MHSVSQLLKQSRSLSDFPNRLYFCSLYCREIVNILIYQPNNQGIVGRCLLNAKLFEKIEHSGSR